MLSNVCSLTIRPNLKDPLNVKSKNMSNDKKIKRSGRLGIVVGVLLVILIVIGFWASKNGLVPFFAKANEPVRQAVFLTNGQVYFGEIEKENDKYLVLRGIYYLKTQDQLNPNTNSDKKISIIKLGDELHGPQDRMFINRDQVLFYEPMKPNSKINEAIKKYLSEKK